MFGLECKRSSWLVGFLEAGFKTLAGETDSMYVRIRKMKYARHDCKLEIDKTF